MKAACTVFALFVATAPVLTVAVSGVGTACAAGATGFARFFVFYHLHNHNHNHCRQNDADNNGT